MLHKFDCRYKEQYIRWDCKCHLVYWKISSPVRESYDSSRLICWHFYKYGHFCSGTVGCYITYHFLYKPNRSMIIWSAALVSEPRWVSFQPANHGLIRPLMVVGVTPGESCLLKLTRERDWKVGMLSFIKNVFVWMITRGISPKAWLQDGCQTVVMFPLTLGKGKHE